MINATQGQMRQCGAGVKDKMFICSLPSRKPTLLISGSPSLVGFQDNPLEMRTFPFHHYVEANHIPFLSRGISRLLLGHGPCRGVGWRQQEHRRWVIQGIALLTCEFNNFSKR